MQDKLLISSKIKKTIEYVRKIVNNYPHEYINLRDKILNTFYELLELTYYANSFKEIKYMKTIVIKIKMIEYYIKISCDYKLINFKKFENIGKYLLEINLMVNKWIINEKNRQSI